MQRLSPILYLNELSCPAVHATVCKKKDHLEVRQSLPVTQPKAETNFVLNLKEVFPSAAVLPRQFYEGQVQKIILQLLPPLLT